MCMKLRNNDKETNVIVTSSSEANGCVINTCCSKLQMLAIPFSLAQQQIGGGAFKLLGLKKNNRILISLMNKTN